MIYITENSIRKGIEKLIPMYVIFAKANLINNLLSVILIYLSTFVAGNILLLTTYFKGISNEILEASRMDGCGFFQTIWNAIVPLGKPAIMINVIFNSIGMWNDLLQS